MAVRGATTTLVPGSLQPRPRCPSWGQGGLSARWGLKRYQGGLNDGAPIDKTMGHLSINHQHMRITSENQPVDHVQCINFFATPVGAPLHFQLDLGH